MKPGDGKLGRDQETLLERETLWKSRLPGGDVSMSLEQGKDESGGERKELAKVACLPRATPPTLSFSQQQGCPPLAKEVESHDPSHRVGGKREGVSDCLPFLAAHIPTGEAHFSLAVPRFLRRDLHN